MVIAIIKDRAACVMPELEYNRIIEAKRMLVDSIWKSANLDGLGTTFPKTEVILRIDFQQKNHSRFMP